VWFDLQREDLIGGIGAIGSALAVVLGYLWSLGLLQLLFSFLAGSFSTYLIQHRLQIESEKRRIFREHRILMRDKIYGPLFQAMNQALELLEDVKRPDLGTYDKNPLKVIQEVMDHHLFRLTEEKLRNNVSQLYDELVGYREVLQRAERAIYDLAHSKFTEVYTKEFNIVTVDPQHVVFHLNDHGITIKYVRLIDAILKRTNPLKLFQEAMAGLENPTIEVFVDHGYKVKDLKKLGEVYEEVEQLAWKENRLLAHEKQRKKTIDALRSIVPELEKRIVV